jgi:hypothetical protein
VELMSFGLPAFSRIVKPQAYIGEILACDARLRSGCKFSRQYSQLIGHDGLTPD